MSWWRRQRPERRPGERPEPVEEPRSEPEPPTARAEPRHLPGPPAERTTPVTATRIYDVVTGRGYHVRAEPDASLSGMWDGYQFQLRLAGEEQDFLSVRGTWGRLIPDALVPAVAQAVNDWNRDKIWPTVFTAPTEDGLTVRTEIMADVGAGATDRQLLDIIEGGLAAGVQFFQALGRSMPPIEEPSPDF